MCIMEEILHKPKNPRQLALALDVDYSTIRHSLRVLEKNRILYLPEKKYAGAYVPTAEFESMREQYNELRKTHVCDRHKVKA